MYRKPIDFFKNPFLLFISLGHKGCFNWISDETYLKLVFRIKMGKKLNLKNPQTYSEKLQWIKLFDRRLEYTQMVDKYEAKYYVKERIGEKYIIPTLGVWDNANDIDFEKLPNQFVLKTTHDSGGIIICKDKSKLNIESAKKKLSKCLKHNFFWGMREWPYKNVKPRIIAEKYMEDETGELRDFKFFCFNGEVKAMFLATDRSNPNEETKFDFFDENFHHLPFTNGHPNAQKMFVKPDGFEKMKELASKLSKGIPQVRIDFYNIKGEIYFGEITFFHWSGLMPFNPEDWDYKFGSWINLSNKV